MVHPPLFKTKLTSTFTSLRHFIKHLASLLNPLSLLTLTSPSFHMEPLRPPPPPKLNRIVRTISKLLLFRTSRSNLPKLKHHEKAKNCPNSISGVPQNQSISVEKLKIENGLQAAAVLGEIFAGTAAIKAAYAQLQAAQAPYDPDKIQSSDQVVVHELRYLCDVRERYLNKQIDESDESLQVAVLRAEIKEQKSVLKSYEVMKKKLDSQLKLRESEISRARRKLEECDKKNDLLEKELDPFGSISIFDGTQLSELNGKHFVFVLQRAIELIKGFIKLLVSKMGSAGWDLDAVANSIEPGIMRGKGNVNFYIFESFVCQEMFDGFHYPNFLSSNQQQGKWQRKHFFDSFKEMKSTNAMKMLKLKPGCSFGEFCRVKYLGLVHPKMELAFFGNLDQRNELTSGGYPESTFFTSFVETAKHIWLLHCLAFSYDPEVKIYQVRKGCRFSEVYMESVVEDATDDSLSLDPRVGFTVIPGFKIGKTVIHCQVYLFSA